MIIYDEDGNIIENPDLTKGYLTIEEKVIGQHDEVWPGTDLHHLVIDTETYYVYHEYKE